MYVLCIAILLHVQVLYSPHIDRMRVCSNRTPCYPGATVHMLFILEYTSGETPSMPSANSARSISRSSTLRVSFSHCAILILALNSSRLLTGWVDESKDVVEDVVAARTVGQELESLNIAHRPSLLLDLYTHNMSDLRPYFHLQPGQPHQ